MPMDVFLAQTSLSVTAPRKTSRKIQIIFVVMQYMGINTPEVKSLKDGEYVGVRRFTRILERGPEAKSDLDKVIDRCGSLVNLRTAIMRYRKPRRWFRFYRSCLAWAHITYHVNVSCTALCTDCGIDWSQKVPA